ncbi:HisA/HisF-related TIM barrel protein [Planctomicrobium sp. SH527]|uniref:HisA/HisF-related TIM barrel protein n=1 Tax=Planctomicrobium sp. SH527 TaxID=3448123 RepID=UPI003F5C1503
MDLIPVIDLMNSKVVRALAGRRDEYEARPSKLCQSSDPVETCLAFKQAFSPKWIYVADLDAIRYGVTQGPIIEDLVRCGVPMVVDAGSTSAADVEKLLNMGVSKVVIGLETLPDLDLLQNMVSIVGADQLIFSLDLREGTPIGKAGAGMYPLQVVSTCLDYGIRHLIILEFSRIGTNRGVPTGQLCHSIKERRADVIVWTGGGVRELTDLRLLQLARVDGAMVATALHEGYISPADWQFFQTMEIDKTLQAMDS